MLLMDLKKLKHIKMLALTAAGEFPNESVFSGEQVLELLDEIDRLDQIIYQSNNMQFKDQ